MSGIKKRPLGKTGLDVTEVGFGSVFISTRHSAPREEAIRVVHRALELGVNYIDTAPMYGNAHEIMGEALADRKEEYLLGTKCGRWDWKTGPYRDIDAFKRQFEQSLKDLRRDSVDLLYIHEADWAVYWQDMDIPRDTWHVDPSSSYEYASAPVVQFLQWAKHHGMAKHLGISGNNAHLLAKVLQQAELEIEIVLVAFQYNLIWRNACEYVLPLAGDLGVGVVLGAPLQQGRLAVPRPEWLENPPEWMDEDLRTRFGELYEIHGETGMSLAELAIRFLLADPGFATVIPGAATVEQLEENIRSSAVGPLPPEIHARLDALGKVFSGIHG